MQLFSVCTTAFFLDAFDIQNVSEPSLQPSWRQGHSQKEVDYQVPFVFKWAPWVFFYHWRKWTTKRTQTSWSWESFTNITSLKKASYWILPATLTSWWRPPSWFVLRMRKSLTCSYYRNRVHRVVEPLGFELSNKFVVKSFQMLVLHTCI